MKDDKCTTPRCRGSPEVEYKGKWLCEKCWVKLCDQEDRATGQARNKAGVNI